MQRLTGVVVGGLVCLGCGEGGGGEGDDQSDDGTRVTPALVRLETSTAQATVARRQLRGAPTFPWTSDVTIRSYRIPIYRVALAREERLEVIYECAAGDEPDRCMVDLAAGSASMNLLLQGTEDQDSDAGPGPDATASPSGQREIPAGTYEMVYFVASCSSDALHVEFAAEATIGGTAYFTDPVAPTGVSSTATEARALTFTPEATPAPDGCNNYGFILYSPVTIAAGDTVQFEMYFDLTASASWG